MQRDSLDSASPALHRGTPTEAGSGLLVQTCPAGGGFADQKSRDKVSRPSSASSDMKRSDSGPRRELLALCSTARPDGTPTGVRAEDIAVVSLFGSARISMAMAAAERAAKKWQRPDNESDLVRRARPRPRHRRRGLPRPGRHGARLARREQGRVRAPLGPGHRPLPVDELRRWGRRGRATELRGNDAEIAGRELPELLRYDAVDDDICGARRPLVCLNYNWVTTRCLALFAQFKDRVRRLRNPVLERAHASLECGSQPQKRAGLAALAILEQDDECLRAMADVFQSDRVGFMTHIYWENLLDPTEGKGYGPRGKSEDEGAALPDGCVMC